MKRAVVALVLVLLAACSPQPAVPVRITTAPTLTVTPVLPTSTPTSIPTVTPTTTLTPIFNYPDSWPSAYATPTPIATPQQDSVDFRLKTMTEADYIALINQMDQVARDWDTFGPSLSRGTYMWMQNPIELLLQEAILRFPDSPNLDAYQWHLAVSRAISGNSGSDPWLVSRIEQALQAGECTIETLDAFLQEHGFKVGRPAKLFNAFGDQRESWAALVSVKAADRDSGLFLVISRDADKYKAYPLTSYWNFDHGTSSLGSSQDYNKNGLTEILVETGGHSGTVCGSKIQLFEWRNGGFVDLTKGQIYVSGCSAHWRIYNEQIFVISDYETIEHYFAWDGQYYTFKGILDKDEDTHPWVNWKTLNQLRYLGSIPPEREAALLEKMIVSFGIADKGSAYPDYLRYRLGVVYAMQSRQAEAVKVFEDLISNPSDPTRDLFPRMARTFLKQYHGDADLYRACLAGNRLFEQFIPKKRFGDRNVETLVQQGVNLDWLDAEYAMPLCDPNQALTVMVRLPDFADGGLVNYLIQKGVEIRSYYKIDVNSDGREEFFLALNDADGIMVYTQGDIYMLQELPVPYGESIPTFDDVKLFHDGVSQTTLLLIRSDRNWWAYGLTNDFELSYLSTWTRRGSNRIVIRVEDDLPLVQVFGSPYSTVWDGYRWNPLTREFQSDLSEYELFIRKDFARSVEVSHYEYGRLSGMTANTWFDYGHAYYLAALSSELAGDSKTAAKIYWQLWQKFPGSPYAILAKAKLEPVPGEPQ